jgi:hypothetical protein
MLAALSSLFNTLTFHDKDYLFVAGTLSTTTSSLSCGLCTADIVYSQKQAGGLGDVLVPWEE